jgi:Zn-dependent protease with chaperone function
MSRGLVLGGLVLILCGGLAAIAGFVTATRGAPSALRERDAWRRLWAPLAPAVAALALLLGWAIQEPSQTDELLRPVALLLAAPLAAVWVRALIRAARAALDRGEGLPAAVVGLWRPRVTLDPRFRAALDEDALQAVLQHEHAHARHRDPLRIWLAQLATDLQGPFGGAAGRLTGWLDALELARDDEARRAGVRGEDLADALVRAARFTPAVRPRAAATLGSPDDRLAERVRRLLAPLEGAPTRTAVWAPLLVAGAVAVAAFLGFSHGDDVLRALPFVGV